MKLLALDGNSIINRAFYGIKLLTTKDGVYTNGVYGFMNILGKLMDDIQPDAVAAAFDMRAPTFRHKEYAGYKAGRKGMPDELASQLPVLKELLAAFGYHTLETPGFEADDILGTLAKYCGEQGHNCVIATGDRDTLQMVGPHVTVYLAATKMGRPQVTVYDREKIAEDYKTEPRRLIDIKALMGDPSDNIPGVSGVGQKTAVELVSRFGGIDDIYENIDTLDIRETLREKLKNGKDSAYLSYRLGTIATDAPVEKSIDTYKTARRKDAELLKILKKLEFYKMIDKLELNPLEHAPEPEESEPETEMELDLNPELDAIAGRLIHAGTAHIITVTDERGQAILVVETDKISRADTESPGFDAFIKTLFSSGVKILTQDAKELYKLAEETGAGTPDICFATSLAGYLLNPSANNYDLDRLISEYNLKTLRCSWEPLYLSAAAFPALCERMRREIDENDQQSLLFDIEIPLAKVLCDMETAGFMVDINGIEAYGVSLGAQISALQSEIYELTGYEFNLNSPKQLAQALFEKLGLPAKKKTKSGYSTNAEVLESLKYEHPAVEKLLEYRQLAKLKSTYCDGLLKVIGKDGRIHSTLNQTETRTGRISSTEPNLQNIPVRQEAGRELRRFFTAAKGCVLCDADYSQIELRILAHMASDSEMIGSFNAGEDIHTNTAAEVFNMPPALVTPLMRSRAKAVNFGIVYGIGAFSLSKDIGVTRAEADRYIKGYFEVYPGVAEYMEKTVREAKERGYAQTLFGRRRYLPELASSNANLRAFGERVARNMPIQGTAADIIKIAMVRVWERLRKQQLKAKLILQVHDELLVEAPEDEAEVVTHILKEEMESACEMAVTLLTEVHTGKTWYDAKG